jgi:uncharacterized protein (DUF58 family)
MSDGAFSNPLKGRNQAMAIFALIAGAVMVTAYYTRKQLYNSSNALTFVIYVGVGGLLILIGLRMIGGGLLAQSGRLRPGQIVRWYRASMPGPALAYLGILFILLVGSMMGRASPAASNMLLLTFGMMAGPFVVNGSITFSMLRNAVARRRLPRHAVAAEPFTVDLRLENFSGFFSSWMMTVRDTIQGLGQGAGQEWSAGSLFTRVGRMSSRESLYQMAIGRRGRYRFGPLQITSRFPMGLVERSVVLEDYQELLVFPRIGRVVRSGSLHRAEQADLVHQPAARRGTHDDEFHALREFRPGDAPRAIHWKTTARRNELMVREFEQQRRSDLTVWLDLWLPANAGSLDRQRVELAVSVAATLFSDQGRHAADSTITLGLFGETLVSETGFASSATIESFLTTLAVVAPAVGTAGLGIAAGSAAGRGRVGATAAAETVANETWRASPRSARMVLISTRPPAVWSTVIAELTSVAPVPRTIEPVDLDPARLAGWIEFPEAG